MELKKTFDTIRESGNPILEGAFSSAEDVFNRFGIYESERQVIDIICANYECECYEGYAVVFYYRRDTEKYYEAYGSHCSCYGLSECEWGMEEIVFAELENRLKNGDFFGLLSLS